MGLRVSFSAKPSPESLGNGAHLHLSLWRGDDNLFGSGDDGYGLAPDARAFLAGLLAELPALLGVVCGSPVSFLRLGPSRWTGVYGCWGLENREAPLRLIQGSRSTRPRGANVELKAVDASGNPYLAVGAAIAAGLAGIDAGLELAPECTIDPATMSDADRAAAEHRGAAGHAGGGDRRAAGIRGAARGHGRHPARVAGGSPRARARRRDGHQRRRAVRALPVPLLADRPRRRDRHQHPTGVAMKIDLEAVPFVDGHMHAPLATRPATADEYAWPWYEGNLAYLEMAAELVPFRWAMRQMGEWLDCEPVEAEIVAAIAARGSDAEWRAECIKRGNVGGLVLDTGYPPPDQVVPHAELGSSCRSRGWCASRSRRSGCWPSRRRSTTGWSASTRPATPASTPARRG